MPLWLSADDILCATSIFSDRMLCISTSNQYYCHVNSTRRRPVPEYTRAGVYGKLYMLH